MKLTVLGKYGPYPKPGGACSGYLVEEGDTRILCDIGTGVLARLFKACSPERLDALVLTHFHYDHTSDLLPLCYWLEQNNVTLKVFAPPGSGAWETVLLDHPNLEVVTVRDGETVTLKDVTLRFLQMRHAVNNLAVRVEGGKTLLYTGDTALCPAVFDAASGADLVLADCSKPEGFCGSHMTVVDALTIRRRTGVRVLATHQSPEYDPEPYFRDKTGVRTAQEEILYEI